MARTEIEGYKVTIRIEGTAPLLQHRYPLETDQAKPKGRTGKLDHSGDAEQALYKDEQGHIVQPSLHILSACAQAAGAVRIEGAGKKSYRDLVKAALLIEPVLIPHENQSWAEDRQPGRRPPRTGGRMIIARPRFDTWALEFTAEVLDPQLDFAALKEIFDIAGRQMGLGEWRPRYGRFKVTKFQRVEENGRGTK